MSAACHKCGARELFSSGLCGPCFAEAHCASWAICAECVRLVGAVTSFSRNIVVVGHRVVYAGPDAAPSARQLLGIIAKYKPLLGAEERESTEHIQHVARLVAGEVH